MEKISKEEIHHHYAHIVKGLDYMKKHVDQLEAILFFKLEADEHDAKIMVKKLLKLIKSQNILIKDLEFSLDLTGKIKENNNNLEKKDTNKSCEIGKHYKTQKNVNMWDKVFKSPIKSSTSNTQHNNKETPIFEIDTAKTPPATPSKIYINFNGIPINKGRTIFQRDDKNVQVVSDNEEATVLTINTDIKRGNSFKRRGKFHNMEIELKKWMKEKEENGKSINKYELIKKAKELEKSEKFKASSSWYFGFLKRCDFI